MQRRLLYIIGIYKLTNKLNGLVYIGQTVDYYRRMNEYKNRKISKSSNYKIMKIINEIGFHNFKHEMILECDITELNDYEMYFIDKFESYKVDKGYNSMHIDKDGKCHLNTESIKKMSISHTGNKHTTKYKKSMSNKIIAFKNNDIIIADSAKIFGDYIGKSKDIIKNGLRKPVKICGYMIFYNDINKRHEILEKQIHKNARNKDYIKISKMLDDGSIETKFSDYNIKYIMY